MTVFGENCHIIVVLCQPTTSKLENATILFSLFLYFLQLPSSHKTTLLFPL